MMELHRIVFRLDFPFAFRLISAWADVLELLHKNKLWTNLGENLEPRRIVAEHKDLDKAQHELISLEMSNFSGSFEAHPIEDPESYEIVFRDMNFLINEVGITSFNRIGTRFLFLEPFDHFEKARKVFSDRVDERYWEQLQGELVDLSISSVHTHEDQNFRVNAGPIHKPEYNRWFGMPESVPVETALLFDIDCFTMRHKFKTFDLRKVVDFDFTRARKQALTLSNFLKGD